MSKSTLYPQGTGDFNKLVNDRENVAESNSSKKNLLITIGDSWTWGDSLGSTSMKYNDKNTRYEEFYTNRLAKSLDADWVMLAQCGCDNNWILNQYDVIRNAINEGFYADFDNVFVHVCMTEMFRELQNKTLREKLQPELTGSKNLDHFCRTYFARTVIDRLDFTIPKLHSFSKNFWNIDHDLESLNFVPDVWQQLLFDHDKIDIQVDTPVLSGVGIYPLLSFFKENSMKDLVYEFTDMLIKINKICDQLVESSLNSDQGTKHPTAFGHRIWANRLYQYYKTV